MAGDWRQGSRRSSAAREAPANSLADCNHWAEGERLKVWQIASWAEGAPYSPADCIGRKVREPERVKVGQIATPDADIPF